MKWKKRSGTTLADGMWRQWKGLDLPHPTPLPPRRLAGDMDRVIRGGATISCPASPLLMSLCYKSDKSGSGLTPLPVIRCADKQCYLQPEIATRYTLCTMGTGALLRLFVTSTVTSSLKICYSSFESIPPTFIRQWEIKKYLHGVSKAELRIL